MSMSKKDYEAFVKVLKPYAPSEPVLIHEIADDLCEVFEADNPRFDRTTFLRALGYDEPDDEEE